MLTQDGQLMKELSVNQLLGCREECKIEKVLCVDSTLSDLYAINLRALTY